jgi:hypothetical protein
MSERLIALENEIIDYIVSKKVINEFPFLDFFKRADTLLKKISVLKLIKIQVNSHHNLVEKIDQYVSIVNELITEVRE